MRGLNERLVCQGEVRVNGFGFGADGSKETLFEFLSDNHRFEELSTQDKRSLESFLLGFPTETPAIVGKTITLSSEQANATAGLLAMTGLLEEAVQAGCEVKLTGRLNGVVLKHTYIAEDHRFTAVGNAEDSSLNLEELLASLSRDESGAISMTVYALP